jgi:uncharacterized protein (TIGR03086 family)
MTEISDRYDRLSQAFADKVAQVQDWDAASPCEGWTARDVLQHVADTPPMFFGLIGEDLGELPEDPVEKLAAGRQRLQAALEDDATAKTEFDGFFGRSTFEDAVNRFVTFDLVIHNCDLSKAAGLDTTLDPGDVALLTASAEGMGDAGVKAGVFKAPLDVPADADPQTRLLGLTGRQA